MSQARFGALKIKNSKLKFINCLTFKIYFSYEYRNEKEHLEADYSAYRINRNSYCYHSWSYELYCVG